MGRTLLKGVSTQLLAWAGVAVLCSVASFAQSAGAPAATSQGQQTAQAQGPRTDGQIEMDVVQALDASTELKNDLITAATIQSEVTLSGTVSSEASKKLAESIVSHVAGVTKVHNNLTVGNPQNAQNMPPAPGTEAPAMPDDGQTQAENGTAGLPPPGPAPEQYPNQGQYPPQAQYPGPYPQQQPYPQQGGGYPPARPQYQNPQYGQYPQQYGPATPAYEPAKGPVTLAPGTLLQLRTSEPVSSKRAQDGQPVQFVVIQDVTMGGVLAIPRGAVVHGVITESKNVGTGSLAGSSALALTLVSLDLGGRNYPLSSDQFRVKTPNKAGETVGRAIGGGLIGTIIGCAVGRGAGCAIGAGAGLAAGTASSAATPGPRAWIPAEALVTFHLNAPLTVDPVSSQEAARLSQGLNPGGPTLYHRRGYGPSGYYRPYGYYGYPYGPPPVYYRPYYMMGGFYYWR